MALSEAKKAREEELRRIFDGIDGDAKSAVARLIDETIFLENQLDDLRRLPMIRVHPSDPYMQKVTPAAKLYKEYLQQYTNCIKVLLGVLGDGAQEEESPLRQWLEAKKKQYETR